MQHLTCNDMPDLWACARTPEAATALARLLLDSAPPDDRNDFGETALHIAAARGNDEAVKLLLLYGADLLAADWESGWTPLHRSLYHQHLSTSLLFLRHAQTHFGRKFLRKYLHETRDHDQQSPMQLLSTKLQHDRKSWKKLAEACDDGLVYTFGKRDYQLGYHLPNADVQITPRLVEFPARTPIIQLSASKYHTIALNAAGECFVWGFGKGGRLGTGNEFDRIEPTRLVSLETTPMKKVAAGENHTMALSRSGQVFSWGSNSFGQLGHPGKSSSSQSRLTPKRIDAFRLRVVADIAASGCHSAAIDAGDGGVYTWGSNRRGQLGRKEGCGTDQPDATPRSIDALRLRHPTCVVYGDYDSVRAEKLALSDWHTCVVLRCCHNGRRLGQVWQFGYGSYRPSRVNFTSAVTSVAGAVMCDTWVPSCMQRGVDIVEVSCAQNHSIALSASGSVFTWGHNVPALSHQPNSSSQDQHAGTSGPIPSPSAPQMVHLSSYGPVASVCASQDHCAVVTHQGDLVTWGCGQQGVLGHGRGNTWQPNPKRVVGVKKAVAVAAGHQHTAVLVAPVHPDFDSEPDIAGQDVAPSLVELVERKVAAHVDVTNCAQVWQFAERYAAFRLQRYCLEYMQCNWDAVLDAVGRDRMETLFDIMLPPNEEPEQEEKAQGAAPDALENPIKQKKAAKKSSTTKDISESRSTPSSAAVPSAGGNPQLATCAVSALVKSPETFFKANGRRKGKNSKFVPLTSFLSNKAVAVPTRDTSSPWGLHSTSTLMDEEKPFVAQGKSVSPASFSPSPIASHAFPEAFPLLGSSIRKSSLDDTSSRQRTVSVGSHPSASPCHTFSPLPVSGKHMLGYDGVEHQQVTAFSLDAFLKQPARRGSRGKTSAPASSTWINPSTNSAVSKTLKEIQEEEEAIAAREREVKARLGGSVALAQRSQSTVNSWGLFRPPDHVSLADVQKLQEEQEFLEQQRQILAEIEREQAAKVHTEAAVGGRRKRSKVLGNKRSTGGYRQGRKPTGATASDASDVAASSIDTGGDSQSKRNKQKKAKERKAARKAAGETFARAGNNIGGTQSTRHSRRKNSGMRPDSAKHAAEEEGITSLKPSQPILNGKATGACS